jgi:hypothetical protein
VPPDYDTERNAAAALLAAWSVGKQSPEDDSPEKLIYPLEHAYTPAELAFDALKGADRAAADVLVPAAAQSGCDLHLALISIEQSGPAEYVGSGRWSDRDDDAYEPVEIAFDSMTVSDWRRPHGSVSTLGELPFEEEELVPPDALEDMEPDEEHFQEATGNEGASFERSYRRAAFVLWPHDRFFAVLNQAGLSITLPFLSGLVERWETSGGDVRSLLWKQADELSGFMVSAWPLMERYDHTDTAGEASRLLTLLVRLGNAARAETFLARSVPQGLRGKGDNGAVVSALGLLPPERAAALVESIIAKGAAFWLSTCADLLARIVPVLPEVRPADLVGAATLLVDHLPGDPSRNAPQASWRQARTVDARFVVDLLTGLVSVREPLAARAADYVLAWSATYDLDGVVIPAVRELLASTSTRGSGAVQRLRVACLQHLKARIAEPLEAPHDWRRANALSCHCRRCNELAVFLADPGAKTWIFRAAEFDRSHVEATIERARCDLDTRTDRRGRPYSLVCTKTQASYERRLKQRNEDLANCKWLEA